jgi:hypothetical protein
MVGGQNHERVTALGSPVGVGVETSAEEPVGALNSAEIPLTHETGCVAGAIRQREMYKCEFSRAPTQLGGDLGNQPRVVMVDDESIDLGPAVVAPDSIWGTVSIPRPLVKPEL